MPDNPHRLPREVIPERYDLRIEPDLETFTFTGEVTIAVEVRKPTNSVTLNACELEIHDARVEADGETLPARVDYRPDAQRASLELDRRLRVGKAVIRLGFRGVLNDQLHGFYRSSFTDVDGNPQVIATTQFEATDARRAFPCFDEPDLKAVFGVRLVVPEHLMAVSNGPEIGRRAVGDGKVEITFADTMKMSTYLVAFVVGPFEATEPREVNGVPIRVVAPRGKSGLSGFALEAAAFSLRYFTDYYGIPYPGQKLDLVAIPDFAFGAMENLGCVTFREAALLIDPETAGQAELGRVLDVVAHELAHMWFGDLVTMKWWDGIWLNEAFASFMEMKAADAMRPDWKRWLAFAAVDRPWAYGVDALRSTRPVEFEVGSPEEANEMFDALTYGKGSSVLRMLEQFLGEETFRRGVERYLRSHAYGNTVTDDLWRGLEESSGLPVAEIMDTWIHQGGFPRVDVEPVDGGLVLRQRRFLALPADDSTLWHIPIQIRGRVNDSPIEHRMILAEPETRVALPGEPDWVMVNAGGHGFYRVAYPESLRSRLWAHLEELDAIERYCLVDDLWAFVESGSVRVIDYLRALAAFRSEEEHAVWQAISGGLGAVWHHLVDDHGAAGYRRVVQDLISPATDRLGWEPGPDEPDLTRRLRGLLLGMMGRLVADPETVDRCRAIADRWLADHHSADPDVAQAALFTTAFHGDRATYHRIFEAYRSEDDPQIKLRLLRAVTLFEVPALAEQTLEATIGGEIRNQDSAWVVASLLSRKRAGAPTWKLVREHWDEVLRVIPPATLRRLVEGLPALSEEQTAADVQAFFADRDLPGATKALRQNLERLQVNVELRRRESADLAAHLAG